MCSLEKHNIRNNREFQFHEFSINQILFYCPISCLASIKNAQMHFSNWIHFNKYVDQTAWIHFNKYVDGTYCQALGILEVIEKQSVPSRDLVCIRDTERSKLQNDVRSLVIKECIWYRKHTVKELSSLSRERSGVSSLENSFWFVLEK